MVTRELDLRGRVCPEPYLLALRELARVEAGSTLVVLMDSWKCALLLVESVRQTGMGEAKLEELGEGLYRVTVVKERSVRSPLTSSC